MSTSLNSGGFDVHAYWQLTGIRQLAAAGIEQTEQLSRRTVKGLLRFNDALQALPGVSVTLRDGALQADPATVDQVVSEASAQFNAVLMTCQ